MKVEDLTINVEFRTNPFLWWLAKLARPIPALSHWLMRKSISFKVVP